MIVSALLTSVGINFGLSVLFLTLYSILRKQPWNINVYAPRLVAEGKSRQRSGFNLERLLPSPGWVGRAWKPSEEELLSNSGLDAVVFMRIFTFSLKVFSVAGVVGLFILLPVNMFGNELTLPDFADIPNKSLDVFSIANVENGSKMLWIHFCAVYFITAVVCYLLYHEFNYISLKRIACFSSSKPQPNQFTILVRGIPSSTGSGFSDSVESFFTEYHSSTYLSHLVVYRTSKLHGLILLEQTDCQKPKRPRGRGSTLKRKYFWSDATRLYKRLTHLKSNAPAQERFLRDGYLGLFGRKVDAVNHYEKKLERLQTNVRLSQSDSSLSEEEIPAAFVSFKSCYAAAVASHIQQSDNPIEWTTEPAPEPHDVYWPFFSPSFMRRWISKLVALFSTAVLTLLFLIPVLLVQGLTNLNQLQTFFPFLKGILNIAIVSQVITGYLPSLVLTVFLLIVPPIMVIFSSMQGYISHSEIEKSACNKVLWFTIWNVFFATVLSGSVLYRLNTFLEPKDIPIKLAVAVPGQASFFISYVVTSGWTSLSSELFQTFPLICNLIKKPFSGNDGDDLDVPFLPYYSEIPRILLFGLLGITYFFLAPLILPFLLVFYCLGYIIYRNQILNVYKAKYETGGKFWPIVHNSTIFSLILMQAIAVGIFGLKKVPLASSLTLPLVVLTLLFNEYCRKRFLPMFKTYSAQSLKKKDKEDENDPTMNEFLDKLVTAYQDPDLKPVQYSDNNENRVPLLSSAV